MPDMDVDPPDQQTLCCKIYYFFSTIESEEILVSNFNEVINVPDTPQNYQMKEIVKKQIREHQQAKDAALTELDTIPPCNTPGCFYCSKIKLHSNSPSPMLEEPLIIDENPPIKNDKNESAEISLPKRKPKKQRKKAKDVTDDFVFPKRTARPASPNATEPIAITNSFADLESDVEDEQQQKELPQEPLHP
ncbi:hypothetical protein TNCT_100681 [Trichonephila clavata]|uniref:Uncharacterized protein n=1 Tax=Trichonephila clavata TaxID=2740835 RepID=A0A8X6LXK6_TRICU|nr:hypothetical protein TNCT_100681 [Trichonephila clavata]